MTTLDCPQSGMWKREAAERVRVARCEDELPLAVEEGPSAEASCGKSRELVLPGTAGRSQLPTPRLTQFRLLSYRTGRWFQATRFVETVTPRKRTQAGRIELSGSRLRPPETRSHTVICHNCRNAIVKVLISVRTAAPQTGQLPVLCRR